MPTDRIARQIERLLDECETAVAAGDWARVHMLADGVLRLDAQNQDAAAYLAAAQPGAAERVPGGQVAARPAERRQLTVMFCDLVDSTPLAEQLDPEDLRDLLREYQEACAQVIRGYEGHVAHYMGDGLLVYFGFPHAHEDDPVRAVRAGLEIVRQVPRLARGGRGAADLQSRVGVHYGLVVIGQMGSGPRIEPADVVGITANVAARLQGIAEPGTVRVSGDLAQLLGDRFILESMGHATLKGVSEPMPTFTVKGERRDTPPGQAVSGGSPLVGRDRELATLADAWKRAVSGNGGGAVIRGDPGIGKSRLLKELRQFAGGEPFTAIELNCSALHRDSALYPVIDYFARSVLRFDGSESDIARQARVAGVAENLEAGVEGAALLASLLETGGWEDSPVARLSPQDRKEKTLELFWRLLERTAARNPVMLLVEDLHWVDPSTLELLAMVMERSNNTALLLVATARPDFEMRWTEVPGLEEIQLERLDVGDCEVLALALVGDGSLARELREQVVHRSDGVPLFLEELLKAMSAEPQSRFRIAGAAASRLVPATLHDSLMARLDRMGSPRRLAQVASAVGRTFSFDLLLALDEPGTPNVQSDLQRLVEAGILVRESGNGREEYRFRHALLQDVAYQSLLRSERARLHGRIAATIERLFPHLAEQEPELLAHHLAEAQQADRAIDYLLRGGRRAIARFANLEAVGLLDRALALLEGLPPSPERDRRELELRLATGGPLIAVRGYADAEVERNYGRATELSSQQDRAPERFQSLWGLRRFYQVRGNFEQSVAIAQQLLATAPAIDGSAVVMAEASLGDASFLTGDLVGAEQHLRAASTALDNREGLSAQAVDSSIRAMAERAIVSWLLGDRASAWPIAEQSVTEARATGDRFLLCWSLSFAGWVAHLERRPDQVERLAAETLALATEHSFKYFEAVGKIFRGWHSAVTGSEAGIAELASGLDLYYSIGAKSAVTYFHLLAAEAELARSNPEGARAAIEQGLAAGGRNGERTFTPELFRLRAAVSESGASDLLQSLAQARANGSPSLQLRASIALARAGVQTVGGAETTALIAALLDRIIPAQPDPEIADALTFAPAPA